ncbi:MAG: hypothetical protein FWG81_02080 [Betaproteobacteria bacterium]|nr:hypothetical protein [Betaproteobacteria bacterium]
MNLFGQLTQLIGMGEKDSSPKNEEQELLLARTIEMTDRRIAKVESFRETLWPAIQFARIYFSEVLESIPGPFLLDNKKFPFEELFPNQEDLTACLGRSIATKNELPRHILKKRKRVFALLGMRPRTRQDEKIQLVDHTLRSLRRSAASVRRAMLSAAFESLLQGFANRYLHHEKKLEQLRSQQEMLRKSSNTSTSPPVDMGVPEPDFPKLMHDPKEVLAHLVEELHNPARRLQLEYDDGYPLGAQEHGKDYLLPQLKTQDRRHWFICIVEFPVAMAQEALDKETYNHRFILI